MDQRKGKKMTFSDEKDIVWNVNVKTYDYLIFLKSFKSAGSKIMKFKILLN
jgi:hypothetical protein